MLQFGIPIGNRMKQESVFHSILDDHQSCGKRTNSCSRQANHCGGITMKSNVFAVFSEMNLASSKRKASTLDTPSVCANIVKRFCSGNGNGAAVPSTGRQSVSNMCNKSSNVGGRLSVTCDSESVPVAEATKRNNRLDTSFSDKVSRDNDLSDYDYLLSPTTGLFDNRIMEVLSLPLLDEELGDIHLQDSHKQSSGISEIFESVERDLRSCPEAAEECRLPKLPTPDAEDIEELFACAELVVDEDLQRVHPDPMWGFANYSPVAAAAVGSSVETTPSLGGAAAPASDDHQKSKVVLNVGTPSIELDITPQLEFANHHIPSVESIAKRSPSSSSDITTPLEPPPPPTPTKTPAVAVDYYANDRNFPPTPDRTPSPQLGPVMSDSSSVYLDVARQQLTILNDHTYQLTSFNSPETKPKNSAGGDSRTGEDHSQKFLERSSCIDTPSDTDSDDDSDIDVVSVPCAPVIQISRRGRSTNRGRGRGKTWSCRQIVARPSQAKMKAGLPLPLAESCRNPNASQPNKALSVYNLPMERLNLSRESSSSEEPDDDDDDDEEDTVQFETRSGRGRNGTSCRGRNVGQNNNSNNNNASTATNSTSNNNNNNTRTAQLVGQPVKSKNEHNNMERIRRQELKSNFDNLRQMVPAIAKNSKAPKVSILKRALSYCNELEREGLQLKQLQEKEKRRNKRLRKMLEMLQRK